MGVLQPIEGGRDGCLLCSTPHRRGSRPDRRHSSDPRRVMSVRSARARSEESESRRHYAVRTRRAPAFATATKRPALSRPAPSWWCCSMDTRSGLLCHRLPSICPDAGRNRRNRRQMTVSVGSAENGVCAGEKRIGQQRRLIETAGQRPSQPLKGPRPSRHSWPRRANAASDRRHRRRARRHMRAA